MSQSLSRIEYQGNHPRIIRTQSTFNLAPLLPRCTMAKTRRAAYRKCTFCRHIILDPGSVLLSTVNRENFSNWCENMLNMESKDVHAKFKHTSACRYCIWDARLYHENTEGNGSSVWWIIDDDPLYKYFKENKIQPCSVKIKKLSKYDIHKWIDDGEKKFKCIVCERMHGTYNAMFLHMLMIHPEKKFNKCRLCNQYIDREIGMQAHLDEVHGEEISTSLKTSVLKCQFCDEIFTGNLRKYKRSSHTKKCHSDIAVRCASFNCCRYFRTQKAMKKHADDKHNNITNKAKFSCIFCGACYFGIGTMKQHVKRYHKHEAHFCKQNRCGKYFKMEVELQAHLKEVHDYIINDEQKISCTICGQRLSILRLRRHMSELHAKDAFKCKKPKCESYFKTKVAAAEHFQNSHIVERHLKFPFLSCANCKFQTRWRHNLETHIVAKHFPKTVKCPDCPKIFASNHHLHEHSRKAHRKNKKNCVHCGYVPAIYKTHAVKTNCKKCLMPFKCIALLKKHSKLCTLSFECDICDKTFRRERILLEHFEFMHRPRNENLWLGAKKYKTSAFKCVGCKVYFPHEGFYNYHFMPYHRVFNKKICDHCGKWFRKRHEIQSHMMNFLRRFKCPPILYRGSKN